jgi:hypothetical protein
VAAPRSVSATTLAVAEDIYRMRDVRGGFHIARNELEAIARDRGIALELADLRSRSLLSRNASDYKLAHKSIFEYLLVQAAKQNAELAENKQYSVAKPDT